MHCIRGNGDSFAAPRGSGFKHYGYPFGNKIAYRVPFHLLPRALVGIDLGTTNSSIAIIGDKGPRVVADDRGRKSIPSEFEYISEAEKAETGERKPVAIGLHLHDGSEKRSSPGKDIFYSCKRIIGLRWVVWTNSLHWAWLIDFYILYLFFLLEDFESK